jgi:hypothetical protein
MAVILNETGIYYCPEYAPSQTGIRKDAETFT